MERTFFVPVRTSKAGTVALRTGRLRSGERVGLAFTSETSLARTLGRSQQWIHLSGAALADMLAPLGVEHIRVDAHPASEPGTECPPRQGQQAVSELRPAVAAASPGADAQGAGRPRAWRVALAAGQPQHRDLADALGLLRVLAEAGHALDLLGVYAVPLVAVSSVTVAG